MHVNFKDMKKANKRNLPQLRDRNVIAGKMAQCREELHRAKREGYYTELTYRNYKDEMAHWQKCLDAIRQYGGKVEAVRTIFTDRMSKKVFEVQGQ